MVETIVTTEATASSRKREFEYIFAADLEEGPKTTFIAAFNALLEANEVLFETLHERATLQPGAELAQRLEMLSLNQEEEESKKAMTTKLDLTAFSSAELLTGLTSFAALLCQQDAINLAKLVQKFASYGEFKTFKDAVGDLVRLHPDYATVMDPVTERIGNQFKILVLIDLGGTVFFRTDAKDCGTRCDYKFKRYQYYWRPGYQQMLLRLQKHPRVALCFYTSMMRKTIVPVMHELMHDDEGILDAIKTQVGIFDRDYCQEMKSLKYYASLAEEKYDTYRDLQRIF